MGGDCFPLHSQAPGGEAAPSHEEAEKPKAQSRSIWAVCSEVKEGDTEGSEGTATHPKPPTREPTSETGTNTFHLFVFFFFFPNKASRLYVWIVVAVDV